MESGRHDDSKTLTEESDQSEEGTDDTGGSRSYKCVYCKQGFTNAQALGGHMNIHRKDRAKIRQPTVASVSNRHEEGYLNPGFFPPTTSYQTNFWASPEVQRMYQTYVPVSTSSTIYPHGYHAEEQRNRKPQPLSLFNDDWRTNLSLQIGPPRTENVEEDRGQDGKEAELDLELRLGHDP